MHLVAPRGRRVVRVVVGGVLDVGGEHAIVRELRDHLREAPGSIVRRGLGLAVAPI